MKDGVPSKDYVDLEMLNNQLTNLDQTIINLDSEIDYAHISVETVRELSSVKKDTEMLIPIGNGVFFTVNPSDVKNIKLAVGAGVVVEKNPSDVVKFIEKQISKMVSQREESIKLYDELAQRALNLQKKIETNLRSKKGHNNELSSI